MSGMLFNIWTKVVQIKSYLTEQGPLTFANVVDVVGLVHQLLGMVSTFINDQGVQRTPVGAHALPGTGLDAAEAQQQLADLIEVYKWAEAEQARCQTMTASEAQRGPLDWIGKMDPNTKAFIVGLIKTAISQLLFKTGVPLPGFSPEPPAFPAAAAAHRKGTAK